MTKGSNCHPMIPTSRSDLLDCFEGLISHLCRRWSGQACDLDDLAQAGRLAVLRARQSYDPSRGPFCVYAATCIRRAMTRLHEDESKHSRPITTCRPSAVRHCPDRELDLPDDMGFAERRLLFLRSEYGVRELAFLIGCSPSGVVKAVKKAGRNWRSNGS